MKKKELVEMLSEYDIPKNEITELYNELKTIKKFSKKKTTKAVRIVMDVIDMNFTILKILVFLTKKGYIKKE